MKLGLMAGPDTISLAVELGATGVPLPVNALAGEGPVCQIAGFGFNPLPTEKDKQEQQGTILGKAIPEADAYDH